MKYMPVQMPTAATSICLAPDALMSSCPPRPQTFPLQVTWVLDGRSKEGEMQNHSASGGSTDLLP